MPYGPKRTKAEIEEYKLQMTQLMGAGMNNNEIMNKLRLPRATFYRILKKVRKDIEEELMDKQASIVLQILQRDAYRIKLAHVQGLKEKDRYWVHLAAQ